jgi:chorismate mutase
MFIRGIRGAVVATQNSEAPILEATQTLILAIIDANPGINPDDVGSIFFTVTPDLDAAFPALAVRKLGWVNVPIICAREIPVPDSLGMCIRILIQWNTNRTQQEIKHVYLGDARVLRPDISIQPVDGNS